MQKFYKIVGLNQTSHVYVQLGILHIIRSRVIILEDMVV